MARLNQAWPLPGQNHYPEAIENSEEPTISISRATRPTSNASPPHRCLPLNWNEAARQASVQPGSGSSTRMGGASTLGDGNTSAYTARQTLRRSVRFHLRQRPRPSPWRHRPACCTAKSISPAGPSRVPGKTTTWSSGSSWSDRAKALWCVNWQFGVRGPIQTAGGNRRPRSESARGLARSIGRQAWPRVVMPAAGSAKRRAPRITPSGSCSGTGMSST